MIDLVYPLRAGGSHEELRYSLRAAAANLPHARVFVVGPECPRWLAGPSRWVRTLESNRKWANIPAALEMACRADVGEAFVYMNDDFFIMRPVDRMPVLHRGEIKSRHGTYGQGFEDTSALLRQLGADEPLLNYELHVPLPVVRDNLLDALLEAKQHFRGRVLQARTLYGNLFRLGGEYSDDVKVHGRESPRYFADRALLSTNDGSFGGYPIGKFLRATFPEPSVYEKEW